MNNTIRSHKVRASELTGRGWLNTGGKDINLQSLRGKIVILDFWTLCCINCLHVLDELRPLEEQYGDVLVTIGVHSPKFEHEADPKALEAAIDRYDITHPVLDDPKLSTWQSYTARAWPTLVVIDPEGYIVAHLSGEGHVQGLTSLVEELIQEHKESGTLRYGDSPYVPRPKPQGILAFPGKAIELPAEYSEENTTTYLVTDSARHRLVQLNPDLETPQRTIGTTQRGWKDGNSDEALFNEPQGLCLVPEELRETLGYDILIADTVNHRIRALNWKTQRITTIAGNGVQRLIDGEKARSKDHNHIPENLNPTDVALSSPWDITWSHQAQEFIIAMAGTQQLFSYNPHTNKIRVFAGTGAEGLKDGTAQESWFAQPSGLAEDYQGNIWVADSETSALRLIRFENNTPHIETAIGVGLFDFGYVDGHSTTSRLQHPLGLTALPDGSIAIADTYNGAIRRYQPETQEVTTLIRDLDEPSDVLIEHTDTGARLIVVEANAHQLIRINIPENTQKIDEGSSQTARPATSLKGESLQLVARFSAPTGQKLDYRWGDPTQLQVSSTPEEFILSGAGTSQGLQRSLTLNPQISNAVLHITARAAACDGEEGQEIPEHAACHLYQQDWGIPVVVDGVGEEILTLDLRGINS
ncbi:NHL domain-containing thioredoxin family protein [Rothia sp. P7208]|uniref:NHL domain-containing thioredoxin family protein n=1 Tax=Rothia sp. P7208 TaxID=3402660 RepID=UPI003AD2B8C5